MKTIFTFLFVLLYAGKLCATEIGADFAAANELYAKGKYTDAAVAYEKILQAGAVSPELLFNCGNAEFKAGNLGRAIAALQRAEQLAPRDAEIRANLDFIRSQVPGAALRESHWQNWPAVLTLNEWTWLTVIAFWLAFVLLAARQVRPTLAPRLKNATFGFIGLTVLAGAILGMQVNSHFSQTTAVVVMAEATARSGPFADAQNAFTTHNGTELSVVGRHDDWVQVTDASGKSGWLPLKQVELLPGA